MSASGVLSTPTHIASAHFDVASLSEGLYFLRLEVEGNELRQTLVVAVRYGCITKPSLLVFLVLSISDRLYQTNFSLS